MSSILIFCVSFFASIAGAICGIGGGVIIKPVLDMLGLASVATISFLFGVHRAFHELLHRGQKHCRWR